MIQIRKDLPVLWKIMTFCIWPRWMTPTSKLSTKPSCSTGVNLKTKRTFRGKNENTRGFLVTFLSVLLYLGRYSNVRGGSRKFWKWKMNQVVLIKSKPKKGPTLQGPRLHQRIVSGQFSGSREWYRCWFRRFVPKEWVFWVMSDERWAPSQRHDHPSPLLPHHFWGFRGVTCRPQLGHRSNRDPIHGLFQTSKSSSFYPTNNKIKYTHQ